MSILIRANRLIIIEYNQQLHHVKCYHSKEEQKFYEYFDLFLRFWYTVIMNSGN